MKPILTIGYGNRSIPEVMELLIRESIEFVIDVRSNPTSRFNPQFCREPLMEALGREGIKYVFMGNTLGGRPPDPNCYIDGHVVYDLVRDREFYRNGLQRLLNASKGENSVCLLCSEGKPEDCHRSKLIGVSLNSAGFEALHFDINGLLVSQELVMRRLESQQVEMFGLHLRSRKAYSPVKPSTSKQGTSQ